MNMKKSALRAVVVLAAAAVTAGGSLLKVSVSTGDPLPERGVELRMTTRGFYYDMAAEIARTADSIAAATPDLATRIRAVRWKIRATRAGVEAAMQSMPDVALADLWILCRRMDEGFARMPDSLLFGPQSPMARALAARLDRRIARLARETLDGERYALAERFVAQYVRDHPAGDAPGGGANTVLAWTEFLRAEGREPEYATGTIAEVLADVNDRVSGQTQHLSSSIGWSKDLIEMQLREEGVSARIEAQLDSLDRQFGRLALVAEQLPELSEAMVAELGGQLGQLLEAVDATTRGAFADLERQRTELQGYVSAEREELVGQLRDAAAELVREAFDAVPGLVGRVLLCFVLALAVLVGGPFALGMWLGGVRERARRRG